MRLNSRTNRIITIILDEEGYITANQIAKKISVSSRTVLRELDYVEPWLMENGVYLDKKKGKGIRIKLVGIKRDELLDLLKAEDPDVIYSPKDRQVIIRSELLKYHETTKIYTLTKLFGVTEGTIGHDLETLKQWFEQYNLDLVRKPGLGIYIQGEEIIKRRAIIALIYEHFREGDLIKLISSGEREVELGLSMIHKRINHSVYDHLNLDSIPYIKKLLTKLEEGMGYKIADNCYISLIIRFSMTLKRIDVGSTITILEKHRDQICHEKIYLMVKEWCLSIEDNPFKKLGVDELCYLAMHIKGAKLRGLDEYNKISMVEDFRIIQLAKEFIVSVERETGIYLEDNEKLLIGLIKHLRPAIYRLRMNLDIVNPLLEDIKARYSKLFQAVKNCVHIIEEKEQVHVGDDEIAYLVVHIVAASKNESRNLNEKFHVVVACSYGIGASQLLISEIQKYFSNIQIVKMMSVMDLKKETVKLQNIDFVISTMPIVGLRVPCVVVNSIMVAEDFQHIKEALENCAAINRSIRKSKALHLRKKLTALDFYSKAILEILKNFSFEKDTDVENIDQLIQYISADISTSKFNRKKLQHAFKDREEKGSTFLGEKGIMLLHCRSEVVHKIYFKVLRTRENISITNARGESLVDTFIIMVAPIKLSYRSLEVFSEISRAIITSEFSQILKEGNEKEVYMQLNIILDQFYQDKVLIIE